MKAHVDETGLAVLVMIVFDTGGLTGSDHYVGIQGEGWYVEREFYRGQE